MKWIVLVVFSFTTFAFAAPVITPISNTSIPAGKSITIPVTATSTNGRPLTFTALSSTNRITVEVHTNNPFWKMSVVQVAPSNAPGAFLTPFRDGVAMVTNVGDMTFMLLRDRAPRTVDAIMGLTSGGFYNSNSVFHRVEAVDYQLIQGGAPGSNGVSTLFSYDDEYHPRSLYSSSGQLGCAKAQEDGNGSQFFVTARPERGFDLRFTIFGQLVRGSNILSTVLQTPTDANRHPLNEVIITRAAIVPNTTDTVVTLTGTNLANVSGTIRVIADDGLTKVTNTFTATTISDAANNTRPILLPNLVTNLVAAVNKRITNYLSAVDLEGDTIYWDVGLWDTPDLNNASNYFNITTRQWQIIPNTGYTGLITAYTVISPNPLYSNYDIQLYYFGFGETAIKAYGSNFVARPMLTFSNQLLATFTNGVPNSAVTNFQADINWGDNGLSQGVIVTNAAGRKEIRGTHTYTNSGTYPIYIRLTSYLGASTTVVSTSTVLPSLTLQRSGTNNTVSWPAWAFNYAVQTHTNLTTTNWVTLTNAPVLSGYDNVVTNSSGGTNGYFRLKK